MWESMVGSPLLTHGETWDEIVRRQMCSDPERPRAVAGSPHRGHTMGGTPFASASAMMRDANGAQRSHARYIAALLFNCKAAFNGGQVSACLSHQDLEVELLAA